MINDIAGYPILHQRPANSSGGEVNKTIIYVGMNNHSLRDVDAAMQKELPEEQCHHSYDCCGHWYRSAPDVRELKPNVAKVVITHRINC